MEEKKNRHIEFEVNSSIIWSLTEKKAKYFLFNFLSLEDLLLLLVLCDYVMNISGFWTAGWIKQDIRWNFLSMGFLQTKLLIDLLGKITEKMMVNFRLKP